MHLRIVPGRPLKSHVERVENPWIHFQDMAQALVVVPLLRPRLAVRELLEPLLQVGVELPALELVPPDSQLVQ